MLLFKATIEVVGINPYVLLPDEVLAEIFLQAQKDKGPIPVKGTVNGSPFQQNLVKLKGIWRLYINTAMLKNSPKRIGETITIDIEFDPTDRAIAQHPKLVAALKQNKNAKAIFDGLTPSMQKEIVRYISQLKSGESVNRNITRAIDFLLGKGRFIGRDGLKG